MKISDPLGKVYTHTMFKKKKGYDMRGDRGGGKGADEALELSDEDVEGLEEEEEDEDVSEDVSEDASDQSDDSLSTKSSRLAATASHAHAHAAHRGSARRDSRPLSVSFFIFNILKVVKHTHIQPFRYCQMKNFI